MIEAISGSLEGPPVPSSMAFANAPKAQSGIKLEFERSLGREPLSMASLHRILVWADIGGVMMELQMVTKKLNKSIITTGLHGKHATQIADALTDSLGFQWNYQLIPTLQRIEKYNIHCNNSAWQANSFST